jgi:NADPH:quinone reductase-like Zn-dependent oxidoreductase
MHAAVVRSFDRPPRYESFDDPQVSGDDEVIVDVLAVGLHPRVRSGASGGHYTSEGRLPLVPGVDGVGRLPDGQRVYFVAPDDAIGTMAERTVIDQRRSVVVPDSVDSVIAAAAINPAMSSWVALRRRVAFKPGQRVLILGATGNAGQMAVQVAKHLGAAHVVAVGRNQGRLDGLPSLGADVVVSLADDPDEAAIRVGEAASEVDVVIDYLWGPPAEQVMLPLLRNRSDRSRLLSWIQIGAVAGPSVNLPSVALRSANLIVLGSGQGSVTSAGILAELPALLDELARGTFVVNAVAVPLAEVEDAWLAPVDPGVRLVFTPTT